jgi:hypothetical protein
MWMIEQSDIESGLQAQTLQKTRIILPHLESDRIRKPSLYNKEFDRRTADVILGSLTSLFPVKGKEKEHHSTLCDQGVSSRFDLGRQ